MSSRDQLIAMARRSIEHAKADTVEQEPDVHRVPVSAYTDPDRYRLEVDRIFRRLPLLLAFSTEMRAPGAYKSMDVAGVPVLLSRGQDGALRAFVNQCSHRGAVVVPEGTGTARRFACPYHAWTYDQHGDLVGILSREDFGAVDTSCLGLTPLPVGERAGLVWVSLTPGTGLDLDTFLAGYDELLALFHFEDWHVVSQRRVDGPNWKVAYDGYLDLYHLPILHRDSFGPDMPNRALYTAWGPHQRVTSPSPKMVAWEDIPEDEWDETKMLTGVWTVFPHISIATFDAGGRGVLVSQLFPGDDVGSSYTVQNYLIDHEPTDEERAAAQQMADFLEHVVRDEDYATGLRIQRAAQHGAKKEFLFGRNEGGGHRFHRWVERLIATEDADLLDVFLTPAG